MSGLPRSFYEDKARRRASFRAHAWLYALLALASGWMLFDLPGAPLHVLRLPEDLPSFGVGLADTFIEEDGTWIIKRQFYADRMGRYEIDRDGNLTKFRGALRGDRNPEMEGGTRDPDSLRMPGGTLPKVRPGRRYLQEIAQFRREHGTVPLRQEPSQPTPEQAAVAAAERAKDWDEPYVIVMTYNRDKLQANLLLQGHTYYAVIDAWTFRHPNIYVTTDKLRHIHRIRATDVGGLVIEEAASRRLELGVESEFDSRMGIDPASGRLWLLLHTGDRYWFDPETLEQVEHEKLPGVWEREYAAVGFMRERPGFPQYAIGYGRVGGWPLTERGYLRLLRVLAVVFIASLMLLALELMQAWRSTSEQTTAATS